MCKKYQKVVKSSTFVFYIILIMENLEGINLNFENVSVSFTIKRAFEVKQIKDYMAKKKIPNRNKAVRELLELGFSTYANTKNEQ